MAIREKTIQFAVPSSLTLVADATVTNLDQITVYIPEASPTITNAFVEVAFHDVITATGGTITEHRCGLRLGAAAYTTITELDDIAQTGENIAGVIGPFNFTSHFSTNWTGTSMTCDIQVYFNQNTGTTQGMANVSAVLYVTYTYDDTAATQIKTVRLPMESLTTALPAARNTAFGNQIPQLTGVGGILPEAGVIIRDYHFVIEGNTCLRGNNTDPTLNIGVDGTVTHTFMTTEAALASDCFGRWIWAPGTIPDTTTDHLLELWSTGATRFNHITITLVVTYEFTLAGTSRVLNSILVPIEIASPLGVNTTAEASRISRDIFISEPGTITMRNSSFRINWNYTAAAGNIFFRCGDQAYRQYTTVGNVLCGMMCFQQRIDSGSVQGTGLTLQRGRNTFVIDGYGTNTTNQLTNINGFILLNYESDLASQGIGAHNHTVYKTLLNWDAALTDRVRINNYAYDIPETEFFITSAGFNLIMWQNSSVNAITFDIECLAGEGKGSGYYDIYADAYQSDAERACSLIFMQGRATFQRFPGDIGEGRVDIETLRDYRLFTASTVANGIISLITYHSITWTVGGNISGHNPSLPTTLQLIRLSDDQILKETLLPAGTTNFNFIVYDNTEQYYVSAFQDSTHVGRSAPGIGD